MKKPSDFFTDAKPSSMYEEAKAALEKAWDAEIYGIVGERTEMKVTFYDPHPGIGGAIIPLPEPMKRTAKELDGQTMTIGEAVKKIEDNAVLSGIHFDVDVVPEYQYIGVKMREGENILHSWRLIRFRD